ncbi:MAG: GDP-mannose 4,6-dehydratase [Bryobacterales bacterium]|nr:GDP-mannose 4,6-dehydratase [Bryobacterales bacterium]
MDELPVTSSPVASNGKRALITGITGQDGSYLAEFLLAKGYTVHGVIRRSSTFNTERIDHLYHDPHHPNPQLLLHYGDLTDASGLRAVIERSQPHEIYNLGAQSHVKVSFSQPEYTADVVGTGALRLLEAVRDVQQRIGQEIRVYQAGSSEMFGAAPPPQSELTPFYPRSPYAVAKVAAHWHGINYRESYGLFVANGVLFNHESPRRGETFVTRKITRAAGRIREGLQHKLFLGNLDARRDWGFAGDYVDAMWRMLQHDKPGDYVVATGEAHSVRDFLALAFEQVELDYRAFVEIDPRYYRPAEVNYLRGDAANAMRDLGWKPTVDFRTLVRMMAEHDWLLARRERVVANTLTHREWQRARTGGPPGSVASPHTEVTPGVLSAPVFGD